jgi:hypothetical protein
MAAGRGHRDLAESRHQLLVALVLGGRSDHKHAVIRNDDVLYERDQAFGVLNLHSSSSGSNGSDEVEAKNVWRFAGRLPLNGFRSIHRKRRKKLAEYCNFSSQAHRTNKADHILWLAAALPFQA